LKLRYRARHTRKGEKKGRDDNEKKDQNKICLIFEWCANELKKTKKQRQRDNKGDKRGGGTRNKPTTSDFL
jgi:hypothetical protein